MRKAFTMGLLCLLGIALVAGCAGQGGGAAAWKPEKFVSWICCNAAGGGYDLYSRGVAVVMKDYVGQELVVQNVGGAGGATGTVQLYRSKPDGLTIGLLDLERRLSDATISPQPDFDLNKFVWLGGIHKYYNVIAVAAKSPYKTVDDLKKAGAIKPIRIATTDVGASEAIVPYVLGWNYTYVTGYSGIVECAPALLRGDAEVAIFPDTTILPYVQSGDLRAVLFQGPEPSGVFKAAGYDIPNSGKDWPDIAAVVSIRAVAAPPGLPANITNFYSDALVKTLKDAKLQEWSTKTKLPIDVMSSDDVKNSFKSAIAVYTKYADVMKKYMK